MAAFGAVVAVVGSHQRNIQKIPAPAQHQLPPKPQKPMSPASLSSSRLCRNNAKLRYGLRKQKGPHVRPFAYS
jgi:hypothetical protein